MEIESESDEEMTSTPQDVLDAAMFTTNELLPTKSKKLYLMEYDNFITWKNAKNASSFSENVLLAYFQHLAENFKASSLWSKYSMIKATLSINHNVDLTKYAKLIAFLKRKSDGYKAKKSSTFSSDQLKTFIDEAPDGLYLFTKVAVIFGIMGACRRQELYNIEMKDVEVYDSTILVKILNTKNKANRSFTITGTYYGICKKYIDLRPNSCAINSFFLNYIAGKCTTQRIGLNKFGNLGKVVAGYLRLPNPNTYTGHCFRRTSATLLVDSGGDITALKRHGGWKSTAVAEGYIDESINSKIQVSNTIMNSIQKNNPKEVNINIPSTSLSTSKVCDMPQFVFNYNNCNVTNNYYNK